MTIILVPLELLASLNFCLNTYKSFHKVSQNLWTSFIDVIKSINIGTNKCKAHLD